MTTPLQLECIKDVRYMGHVPQYKVRTLRGTRTIPPGKTGGLFMLPSMTHFRQEATQTCLPSLQGSNGGYLGRPVIQTAPPTTAPRPLRTFSLALVSVSNLGVSRPLPLDRFER